jgi:hypothetical protein
VWPAHILLGMLGDERNMAARLLARAGHRLEKARRIVNSETPAAGPSEPPAERLALSAATQAMLKLACEIAQQARQHFLTTDHLLLALANLGDPPTRVVLGKLGLSSGTIRQAIQKIDSIERADPPSPGLMGAAGAPDILIATLEVCRRRLAPDADAVHIEQLRRIENILRKCFDLPTLPGTAMAQDVRMSESALTLHFTDGRDLSAPLDWFPRLKQATPEQRAAWEPIWGGRVIRWKAIGQDIVLTRLLRG